MDVMSKAARSKNMAAIKGKNTKPELIVRRFLYASGFRYWLHRNDLLGKPDIVLKRYKVIVFVHGCFWHRHENCPKTTTPKTRNDFWVAKFKGNVERDKKAIRELETLGYRVIVVWECETKNTDRLEQLVKEIRHE